jgi:hypothetical protein
MADLESLKETDNLKRAWRWIKSNPDALYKSYFRGLYQNYSIAEEALLSELSNRLERDVYEPRETCKLFFPKEKRTSKPTQKIGYKFLGKAKALLKSSFKELHDKGF